MRVLLTVASIAIMLGACAVEPAADAAKTEAKNCEREYRVGSTIPVVTCGPVKTEAERQQMLDELRNNLRSAPAASKGGAPG